jgi:hypothetical protein
MNQKSSFREVPQFVSRALTANTHEHEKVVPFFQLFHGHPLALAPTNWAG